MKVKKVTLRNFQAHSDRTVKFSPSITTIVGASDQGKSAILRALGWVCLNNFAGADFVRTGAKGASVKIVAHLGGGESAVIVRERSASGAKNTYAMDDDEFKAFGNGVPDPIAEVLQLNPINFQSQHDPPFWFAETAGELSRQLNKVIDLTVIDSSMSFVSSLVRKNESVSEVARERLEEFRQELVELEPQRARIAAFKKLKLKHTAKEDADEDRNQLRTLVESVRGNRAKTLRAQVTQGEALLSLARSAIDLRADHSQLDAIATEASSLYADSYGPPDFAPVHALKNKAELKLEEAEDLKDLITLIESGESYISRTQKCLHDAEQTFHNETEGAACPLCGSTL